MTVTKTVTGLIYFDELDSLAGWPFTWTLPNQPPPTGTLDTTEKHSGAASFKNYCPSNASWFYKTINLGTPVSGKKIRIWHKTAAMSGEGTFYGFVGNMGYAFDHGSTLDWHWHKDTLNASDYGNLACKLDQVDCEGYMITLTGWVDRLVIAYSSTVTLSGLVPGQKVHLHRSSDNYQLGNETCAAGEDHVHFDIDSYDYPFQMYFEIYGSDGSTLIEITGSYDVCGGDTWAWTATAGTLKMTADVMTIYRQAATGTPKTANLVATLKTPAGAPYPGATIYFSTSRGAVTPASDITDADGEAETALTGETHGLAVVTAQWNGDPTVPAAAAYVTEHIFYEAEAPDPSKDYQFFCQGIEYLYSGGRYGFNEQGAGEDFEVELKAWDSTISANGLVSIYRKGTKEFAGLLKVIRRTMLGPVTLRGPDISHLLDVRVVELELYSGKSADYIINDLLTDCPSGVTVGTLAPSYDSLNVTLDTESLRSAFARIVELIGWQFRVNADRTLDLAESFGGGTTAATFTQGVNIAEDSDATTDYLKVANWVRMKGSGISSVKQDGTKIGEQGLLQAPVYQTRISDQATLDIACQAAVDMKKIAEQTIPLSVVDDFAVGTFGCEDQVYVSASNLGLEGWYTVKRIERLMMEGDHAVLELSNRSKQYWELDESYRRMVKDAS